MNFNFDAFATETCPNTSPWVKIDGLSGKTYTYSPAPGCTVSDNCYKHSTYVHYGTGVTVTADSHCTDWSWGICWKWTQYDLSHASFKVSCPVPTNTPTRTPTPTNTPIPTATPTSTPIPTATPTPTEVASPTPTPTDIQRITGTPVPTSTPVPYIPGPREAIVIPEYHAPSCTTEVPSYALNPKYARSGNTVRISWEHNGDRITKWSINFGYSKDNMPMGIPYLQKEARSVGLNGITWSPVWVAICGYSNDMCQSCISYDP